MRRRLTAILLLSNPFCYSQKKLSFKLWHNLLSEEKWEDQKKCSNAGNRHHPWLNYSRGIRYKDKYKIQSAEPGIKYNTRYHDDLYALV